MKQNLESQLVKKYPELFRDYHKSPKESCMAFGCECGDGWYEILDDLFSSLSTYNIILSQVKEKFGGLRVYIEPLPSEIADEVYDLIEKATNKSYTICENCGQAGKLYTNDWHRTHCISCEEKYQNR